MSLKNRWGVVRELMDFLWKAKLWWLAPLVLILILLGSVLLLAQGSVLAPFIYTLF